MYVLGLTGSIAMGKSWGTACFRYLGIPVHDADACVRDLLCPGGKAVSDILNVFPQVETALGGVDHKKLSQHIFENNQDGSARIVLEHIVHPFVKRSQREFLAHQARLQTPLVVLDIPLLFETKSMSSVDGIVVMSAPVDIQYDRALKRPGMTLQKLHAILNMQIPDYVKCLGADFVIQTGGTKRQSLCQIADVIQKVKRKKGRVWQPGWPHVSGLGFGQNFKGNF